ncbi:MAG: ArsR family transcriptional regulator [Thermoproteota archaeon]|jgi:Fe2+ or Zn2+ uptake regulation protein|nr:ArsR family transcriptional regulator [Thermoproteota archaeon]|tara:strand:- start:58 stop:546 length:489 start_codon:yes stop_codon:yes gene_type:complete
MAVLLKKNISVNRIITIGIEHAKAVDDPLRVKILQILYNKQLDAYRITQHLKKFGHKKALTTIRHHLDILKTAGLIEIVKIEESRGAIIKYYGTSAKFLEFDLPGDFNSRYASIIKSTSLKLEKLCSTISKKIPKKQNDPDFHDYLVMEIVSRATTAVLEKK